MTLLEVLVATTIMGIAVVGLLSSLSQSVRNAQKLTGYERVASVARFTLDRLLVEPKLPRRQVFEEAIEPALLGGVEGGWRARLTPFEAAPGSGPGAPAIERLEVEIWWMDGARRRTFTLDGYRRGILLPEDAP
ncbi:MAG: type IV pilus modification PilV family protein [Bryobacteraceae bacterium]